MNIYLTIPEFIVALFGLDPSQCRLTNSGRIANLHGFAYQVQSLLFEQVKIKHVSYRTETAKLEKAPINPGMERFLQLQPGLN